MFLEAGQHQFNRIKGVKEPKQVDYNYPPGLSEKEKEVWRDAVQYQSVTGKTPEAMLEWYRNKQKEANHAG